MCVFILTKMRTFQTVSIWKRYLSPESGVTTTMDSLSVEPRSRTDYQLKSNILRQIARFSIPGRTRRFT
jgi:hypothetical protein